MKVVEAPTLEAFESKVSNWKTTYSIPPTSPLPDLPHSEFYFIFMSDQYYSEHPQL